MDISHILGENLRRLRSERNLSLGQLAEMSGVSKVMLSQVERGNSNPTVNTLWKIANGLGVSYSSLMESHSPEVDVVLGKDAPTQLDEDDTYRLTCYFSNEPGRGFEIYTGDLAAGHEHVTTEGHGPGTEEFVLVQSGKLTMEVAGVEHSLAADDAIHFDASRPHRYRSDGPDDCHMVIVNTYPRD